MFPARASDHAWDSTSDCAIERAFLPLLAEQLSRVGVFLRKDVKIVGNRASAGGPQMARKYSPSASKDVEGAMRKRKRGTLKSGGSGKKVTSRKQAIAIGLSEARQKGKKVPAKKKSSGAKKSSSRSSAKSKK
jgi:hypothetical protein